MEKLNVDYDTISRTYADYRKASKWVISHITQGMEKRHPRDIVEVGCGTANHLSALSEALGVTGYGFDQSAGMLQEGSKKYPGLCLQHGDASSRYPFESSSFDLVFSVDIIHYINDLGNFYEEAFRVLRPGGVTVTVTSSREDIQNSTLSAYFPEAIDVDLKRFPDIMLLKQAVQDAGFVDAYVSHTEHSRVMSTYDLDRYKNKAYSELLLVSSPCFLEGIERLERDVRNGDCIEREDYTYIWGIKMSE